MTGQDQQMIPTWVEGVLTPVEKLEAHIRGLRHRAVSVFLRDPAGRLLIQRRALGKYHTPGLWANTCCTHPLWDEAPLDCANRRLDQELGITGVVPVWRQQVEYRADVGGGLTEHEVVDIFLVDTPEDVAVTPNPEEVMDTDWLTLPELESQIALAPERYTPWLRIYLDQHKAAIFG
ncbi:isopentenyl-diphosphate Delta-isomerase [Loktanella sp. IMCC34160]|uniref:isopentenyl-diphosphate Delta-isomerase n=1 Tax=Loktanella sp. IMCC34160 TaxID=2510646 RepID=UPI00101DBAFC|nr:isopentenyl-diphosphate Delta-isomerase [Loktanella sp. IMCC34160]RYG91756.1 isopentenyl-diphosphate Delta-isomerase [Loktanella sp. IMCC34160]